MIHTNTSSSRHSTADITVLNQAESPEDANGGVLYVQNAAPDGLAAFMFAGTTANSHSLLPSVLRNPLGPSSIPLLCPILSSAKGKLQTPQCEQHNANACLCMQV